MPLVKRKPTPYVAPPLPLKWHGGKAYLADDIVRLMPPRCRTPNNPKPHDTGWLHYVEPYAGGLAVLLANDPTNISEVVSDTHGDLTNFWSVIQHTESFDRFKRIVDAKPFSEHEYDVAAALNGSVPHLRNTVDRAASFFVHCRQSLAGRMNGFASVTRNRTRGGMNEQASAWLSAVDGLPLVHARMRRVLVLNRPAIDVIRQQDGPRTLFYLDPPYLHETRATTGEYGEHEMTEADHERLITTLAGIKGRFMLSGYRSNMYDEWADALDWKRHEFDRANNAASGETKRRMTECVWTNY